MTWSAELRTNFGAVGIMEIKVFRIWPFSVGSIIYLENKNYFEDLNTRSALAKMIGQFESKSELLCVFRLDLDERELVPIFGEPEIKNPIYEQQAHHRSQEASGNFGELPQQVF